MKPVFSVIIPLYNKESTVKKAIGSVWSQTFPGFEIIVINDGSTDKSEEAARTFADDRLIILDQQNQGAAAARNLGIKSAKGKYMAFLDADDVWEKDHLAELLKLCSAFPDAGMYCMRYRKVYSEKVRKTADFKDIPENFFGMISDYFKACSIDAVASASSVCVPEAVFKHVGLFNTEMQAGEDTEMWIRIALQYGVALNNKTTASYNIHIRNSLSKGDFGPDKMTLLSAFISYEKNNASLKKYIDLNRYALAMRYSLQGDKKGRKEALKGIHYSNLNYKQRLLINTPGFLLKILKKIQYRLAKNHIFLSAFSG